MRVNVFFIYFIMLSSTLGFLEGDRLAWAGERDLSAKRVALVLPFESYSDSQYNALKNVLDSEGTAIKIVSTKLGEATVTPQSGGLRTEMTIDQLNMARFDALIFIGSFSGIQSEYIDNPHAHRAARDAVRHKKINAAL